ncbi:MAG: efflux RND transporter permease subunit [Lewinellaceae bacterium]|nr:efflux RND transporter permease subunit [Lewinellaceae bacterium]
MFYIDVEMAAGSNLEQTNRTVQMVDSVLNEYTAPGFRSSEFGIRNVGFSAKKTNTAAETGAETEIQNPKYTGGKAKITWYASNAGRGNPRIYYNVIRENEAADYGQIFVQLEDETPPPVKIALLDELREKFKNTPGAVINVKNFEQGPPIEAPIVIRVFGENLDTLRSIAGRVETFISETEGTMYVDNPIATVKTDLQVKINKDKAATLGIPVAEIERMIRLAIAGLNVGNFTAAADGEAYNLTVSIPKSGVFANLDVLKNLYINNVFGTAIPLSQVAEIQFKPSPNYIQHYDKDRFTAVTAFVKSGFYTAEINSKIKEKMKSLAFPAGYTYVVAGEEESAKRSFGGLGTIIMITIFGLLAVLILEFKTFRSTVIVLSVIPLGIIGAILILLATGYPFSFTVVVGLIALMGIEVKNSILLVDFTNQLRAEGRSLDDAIQEAGEIRFVPILLTSLTAIGGLLPIAIEENPLYSPLSYVLIGGLISSTLLSRIVTPVLYKLLAPRVV